MASEKTTTKDSKEYTAEEIKERIDTLYETSKRIRVLDKKDTILLELIRTGDSRNVFEIISNALVNFSYGIIYNPRAQRWRYIIALDKKTLMPRATCIAYTKYNRIRFMCAGYTSDIDTILEHYEPHVVTVPIIIDPNTLKYCKHKRKIYTIYYTTLKTTAKMHICRKLKY